MKVPTRKQLMTPPIDAIGKLGGSASNTEIADQIIRDLELSPEITSHPFLKHEMGWARTLLKKQGLIHNSTSGIWTLTVPSIPSTSLAAPKPSTKYLEIPEEDILKSSWEEKLMGILQRMPPELFERLCQRLLRELGFDEVTITGRSGDGGIDGTCILRGKTLISFSVAFQCKRWKNAVGPNVVRDFRGAMGGRAEKGMILTTSTFTKDAKAEAVRDGVTRIDLIDGDLLVETMGQANLGVRKVEEAAIDFAFFRSFH